MPKERAKGLHPRNVHNARYDFPRLIASEPALAPYVRENDYGDLSVDFSDPAAVLMLNRALLSHFYGVTAWSIPKGYLCPPIPGRADYLHYMADLLAESNAGKVPSEARVLDIGVGANCIYPIVGSHVYGWDFVGSDIDAVSVKSARQTVRDNASLREKIEIRMQSDPEHIFNGVIGKKERFAFTLCNPPFHRSAEEAMQGSVRKNRNLGKQRSKARRLNFGGQANELWCPGGEVAFVKKMVQESLIHQKKVLWFSTLVSRKESLPAIYKALKSAAPQEVRTLEMHQGHKMTRIVVWSFKGKKERDAWFKST